MLARVQQQGLAMVGKADQTMDPVFDELNREYGRYRAALDKTEKAVRFHQSAVFANISCLSQIRIEVERNFPAVEGGRAGPELFDQVAVAYGEQVKPKFEQTYEARVFGPLAQYKQELQECDAGIKRRAEAQLNYDVARAQVRSLIAKPAMDPAQLQQAEARQSEVHTVYLALNDEIIAKIRKILAEKDTFCSHFLKGVLESSATVTAGASREITPRMKQLQQYIETIPDATGAEAEDIKLKEVSAPQTAPPAGEIAAPTPQMSTIDQRATDGDGIFGGVTGMATQYGSQPAAAAAAPQADQFGAAPPVQFGAAPPSHFAAASMPAPEPVFAPTSQVPAPVPAPAPAPVSGDPWDNMFAVGGGQAPAPGGGGGSAI